MQNYDDPVARVIALYLPQFHPLPENDKWWGKGFTEWTNVARAKPLYRGHNQPRLPSDLGFYDLRIPEIREAQADLARGCGIEGFCYWHYWFGNGHRIMERPFHEVLESGRPDFPFCLAWANHSWTGIWKGDEKNILIEQTYPGPADEKMHFETVLPAFRDPRYITVDGKPVFVVFSPLQIPDPTEFVLHWRKMAQEHGLGGIFFIAMSNNFFDPRLKDFDAVTPSPPNDFLSERKLISKLFAKIRSRNFGGRMNGWLEKLRIPERIDYRKVVESASNRILNDPRYFPAVIPNWDNTPRSGIRGVVFENATPALFECLLTKTVQSISDRPKQHRIIFLKAWNEWAEGNFVEPGHDFGSGFLDAIRSALFLKGP